MVAVSGRIFNRVCWSLWGVRPEQCVHPGLTVPPLSRSAGPGHRQGYGRPEPVPGWHGKGCPLPAVRALAWVVALRRVTAVIPPSGFGLHEHDGSAHRECEALLHHGTVWARQPETSLWRGRGSDSGLLHPLLCPVEGKDVNQRLLASAGAQGNQGLPLSGVLVPEDLLQNAPLK